MRRRVPALCLLSILVQATALAALPAFRVSPPEPLDFSTRILPILTKAGCNAGTCHGAAIGQGGFRLSLLGYDPSSDYDRIVREYGGRRIHTAAPDESLLLRKATGRTPHGGGSRFASNSPFYKTLAAWQAAGAPYGSATRRVTRITVTPDDALLARPQSMVALRVTATYTDGATEEVSQLALYTFQDDAIAQVTSGGQLTVRARGVTAVMVRYLGQVAAVRVGAPFSETPVPRTALAVHNFIDEMAGVEFERLRLPPSPPTDDSTFLRRACLDLIGTLPTPGEARAFLAEPSSPEKRERLLANLLKRPEFDDFWTLKLADLLLLNSKRLGEGPAKRYYRWLHDQVASNTPLDQLAKSLLTAQGRVDENGAANFYRLTSDPRDMGEYVSRAFLGTRLQCARCHSHPFDHWTQDDYYGYAAFFARVGFDGKQVVPLDRGDVPHPKTNRMAAPRLLDQPLPMADGAGDRRTALAAWLISPQNTLFAESLVNRIWKELMGRGQVSPVDDLRATNPASHPALLRALAQAFVAQKFDLRWLVRTIASSNLYQLSSTTNTVNRQDERFFSHALLKPLPAAVLADALAQVTGVPNAYSGQPDGVRAIQLVDAQTPSYTLDVFGRCRRDTECDSNTAFGGGLPQALHLINSQELTARIRTGVLNTLLSNGRSDGDLVDDLYLRTLSRYPTPLERADGIQFLEGPNRREAAEDLLWALLNTREFGFNH